MTWFKKRFSFLWRLAEIVDTVLGYYGRIPGLAKHALTAILSLALPMGGSSLLKWASVLRANWPLTLIFGAFVGAAIWLSLEAWRLRKLGRAPSRRFTRVIPGIAAKTAAIRPRIKLHDAVVSQLPIVVSQRPSEHSAAFAIVSFYNDSVDQGQPHICHARAEVTIFTERFEVVTKEHEACWVTKTQFGPATAIDPAGSPRFVDLIGRQQAELGLALRFPREPIHFFASSSFTTAGSLHPSFALSPERFFVRVRIYAQHIEGDEFWFHILGTGDANTMSIIPIVKNDASFAIDNEIRDDWLHLVISNPVETRDFEVRADILKREFADYGVTPWWVKWRGKTDDVARRVVTQAELDFIRYELPTDDAGRSLVPGVLHCHSSVLFSSGFSITPGHPTYATGTLAQLAALDEDLVPFRLQVGSVDPKEAAIRTILAGFTRGGIESGGNQRFVFIARFLEDAMKTV